MEELLASKIKSDESCHEGINHVPEKAAAHHVQWVDPILDQLNEDDTDSDTESDNGSDTCDDDDDEVAFREPVRKIASRPNIRTLVASPSIVTLAHEFLSVAES